jgi:hypothetical protein
METCKRVTEIAFDICTEAVKRHSGFPFVFPEQSYYCKHYAEVLHVQCVEGELKIAASEQKLK